MMTRLNPEKLHVNFISPTSEKGPIIPRFYTLTHSDRTGDLFLTIGPEYNQKQINGWYTRLLRDEVLAQWCINEKIYSIHIYCQVGRGLGTAKYREAIFRRELPLVLEAFYYGDRTLYQTHPQLDESEIVIYFHTRKSKNDKIENWGNMGKYSIQF